MVESGLESERKVGLFLCSLFLFFCFLVFVFGFFFHSFSLLFFLPPLFSSLMFSFLLCFRFFFSLMTHAFFFFADAPNVTKTTQKDQSFVVYAILSNIPFIFFPIVQQTYHMYLVILQFKQMFFKSMCSERI